MQQLTHAASPDFWASSGYRLLAVTPEGRLAPTDDFLRAMLLAPELAPVAESDAAEIELHERLVAEPRAAVTDATLARIGDEDVRHNYRVWLRFRDRLLAAPTIEAAYVALFREGVDVAPVFVHHLTRLVLRHILRDGPAPFEARAAEMLFRPQKIALLEDGAVMAADAETVEHQAEITGFKSLGDLVGLPPGRSATASPREGGPPGGARAAGNPGVQRTVDLDVLGRDNAAEYWQRDERFDLAVSLNRGQPALNALCRVLERWIAHFLGVMVSITPQREIDDKRWVWHVGLDAEASALLNDLYNRVDIDETRMGRLLCLFELRFADPADMRPAIAGRPVYLAMAMDGHGRLRLKPQNLLLNLPLARPQ